MQLIQGSRPIAVAALVGLAASGAFAQTVAAFADPALDASTPLFTLVGDQFQGGWSGLNLDLLTPGLPATPDIADATFTMTPLTATVIVPGFYSLTGGQIQFFDGPNLILDIMFDSASLAPDIGFGASDFALQNVTFMAPGESFGFSSERFSFGFANDAEIPNGFSWTASFTSSAVPEPASVGLLLMGLMIHLRRGRA